MKKNIIFVSIAGLCVITGIIILGVNDIPPQPLIFYLIALSAVAWFIKFQYSDKNAKPKNSLIYGVLILYVCVGAVIFGTTYQSGLEANAEKERQQQARERAMELQEELQIQQELEVEEKEKELQKLKDKIMDDYTPDVNK
ncbi:hypothetical protein HCA69_09670 [Listeria grandensis]|uniref:Uncharacterized protein n=1 Tax=Listeria grandensis TaxID=1494963 RepID=A0A7X0Y4V7_9LIST|nr:hypothetical protein [Listeria grandensis]MBC1936634.1 hypothetical protein [Listeria grandensis]